MQVCNGPGCLRMVPDDVRFCDECKPSVGRSDSSGTPDAEFYLAFGMLLGKGLIRPTGHHKDNEMLYEAVPYTEMSDEAKAFVAYLDSAAGRTSIH